MLVSKSKQESLTVDRVRELFDYNPATGIVTRKSTGYELGKKSKRRLYTIIDGVSYTLSRIIWLHYYGVWPEGIVDHGDKNENNNRIKNLRDATYAQNSWNRKTSNGGVTFVPARLKYLARITVNGNRITIGFYESEEAGIAAYNAAAVKYHGEFAGML